MKAKQIFKDTAIYGLSSIVGRFLNYLLVPLYTHVISAESGGYGIVTNIYAYVALLLVFLTFGMETTFFRFANKEKENPNTVFLTTLTFVSLLSMAFLAMVYLFLPQVSLWMGYPTHPDYILMMAAVVTLDAIQAIPFCYLRFQKRPIRFAAIKLFFIVMNLGMNLTYFLLLGHDDVFGVFAINLICTGLITLFFIPDVWRALRQQRASSPMPSSSLSLLNRMLSYTWPLLILGVAGILNQTADKIIFPYVFPDKEIAIKELAIYGACVKVSMIMAMITQAFRYAYEPLVFAQSKKNADSQTGKSAGGEETAQGMKFFLIFTLLAFLCVMAYLPLLRYLVGADYWDGLRVIPIVMVAEIMMGIYFNLSFWYKLIDKTIYGAWFSLAGCAVLVAVNIIFIPHYSYMACAWGGVAGYGTAMLLSYVIGQRVNPISYPLRSMAGYVLITAIIYAGITLVPDTWHIALRLAINTLLVVLFLAYIVRMDVPLKSLPIVGKHFR